MEFPASWSYVKRNLPSLLGYAAGSFVQRYRQFSKNPTSYTTRAIDQDSSRFPTWKGNSMPKASRISTRRVSMRRPRYASRRTTRRGYSDYTVIKRSCVIALPAPSGGAISSCMAFTLSQLPSVSEITNLYRLYRIKKVDIKFMSRSSPDNANGTGTTATAQNINQYIMANDTSKTTPPSTVNDVLSYSNARITNIPNGRSVTHSVYPRAVNTVQGLNIASNTDWLFTDNLSAPHYGTQLWISNANSVQAPDVYLTFTIEVKGRA